MGTLLNGTYQFAANGGGRARIKFGTESNGGFRNIAISDCVFVHCNGLAIESVDGAIIEDVTINNIAMEYISNRRSSSGWARACGAGRRAGGRDSPHQY